MMLSIERIEVFETHSTEADTKTASEYLLPVTLRKKYPTHFSQQNHSNILGWKYGVK